MYRVGYKNADVLGISTEELLCQEFMNDLDSCFEDVEHLFEECKLKELTPEHIGASMFVEKEEPAKPVEKGIVSKLGAAVLSLIQKLSDTLKKFMSRFQKEDEVSKRQRALVEAAIKKDPSLKKQVIDLAQTGALNLQDIKTINELETEVDKLLEEKNPKTLKGKFEKLKKKWDDPGNTKTAKRIAFAASTVALLTAVVKLVPSITDSITKTREYMQNSNNELRNIYNTLENRASIDMNQMGYLETKIAIHRWKLGHQGQVLNQALGVQQNLNGMIGRLIRRVDSTNFARNRQQRNVTAMRNEIEGYNRLSQITGRNNNGRNNNGQNNN